MGGVSMETYKLSNLCEILDAKRKPLSALQRAKKQGIYPYYGAQGIIDHLDEYLLNGEYLLVAEDGANLETRNQPIANIAKGKIWVNNHAHVLGSNGKCPLNLLGFILNNMNISPYVTGCAQPKLNQENLRNIEIELPSHIDSIASILSSLDRKIELNNKINADLEEMAQAIFKNWFVDFEPFKDGKFVDSELGMIPEGWKVGKADDFYQINIGKTPPRKEHQWFSTNPADKIWVSIANMGNSGIFISDSSEYLTKEAVDRHNIIMVPKNTILLSFKLTVGRVAIADKELTTNEAIARFILSDDKYMEYLYLYLKKYDYNSLGSTSSIATAVNSKTIKGMQMLQPSDNVIDAFHIQVNPIFEKIRSLTKENSRLSLLRDTLLPRLMSGEIEIPE